MGRPKYIYFDDDVLENLQKSNNMSKLINDLLREHFRKINPNQMTPEEIRKEIAKRKAWKEYQEKMEKIK
jgi:hypothetical protein